MTSKAPASQFVLSVHDALEAWQAGEIPEAEALRLTGAASKRELYVFCRWSDIDIRDEVPADEMQAVEVLRRELNAA